MHQSWVHRSCDTWAKPTEQKTKASTTTASCTSATDLNSIKSHVVASELEDNLGLHQRSKVKDTIVIKKNHTLGLTQYCSGVFLAMEEQHKKKKHANKLFPSPL